TALAHIARGGVRGLSLREVARGAGVSHTASYRHFPAKESLLAAIAEQGFRLLSAAMRSAIAAHAADPVAALLASGLAYVEFGVQYPEHLQVMFGGAIASAEDYPPLMNASKEAYEVLAGIVREGLRVGRLRGPNERSVALSAWSLVHGLAVLIAGGQIRASGGRMPSRELVRTVIALLLDGLANAALASPKRARGPGKAKKRA